MQWLNKHGALLFFCFLKFTELSAGFVIFFLPRSSVHNIIRSDIGNISSWDQFSHLSDR